MACRSFRSPRVVLPASALLVTAALVTTLQLSEGAGPPPKIAARVDPALVDITATLGTMRVGAIGSGALLANCPILTGTGMVIGEAGTVLTNNHVIEGATEISARDVGNGRTYRAKVLGTDPTEDLALLELEGAAHLRTISVGSDAELRVGSRVQAIGNGAAGTSSVASGRVTALDASLEVTNPMFGTTEDLNGLIETTAVLAEGDSGGALVDDAGRVVGVTTAQVASGRCAPARTEGVAVPIGLALSVARRIESGRSSSTIHVGPTACLGVEVVPSATTASWLPAGALVTSVVPGSPAQLAGLAAGDDVVSLAGKRISSPSQLLELLDRARPGERVRCGWVDPLGLARSSTLRLAAGPPE